MLDPLGPGFWAQKPMTTLDSNLFESTEHGQSLEQYSEEHTSENHSSNPPSAADEAAVEEYVRKKKITSIAEICHNSGLTEDRLGSILTSLEDRGLIDEESGFIVYRPHPKRGDE